VKARVAPLAVAVYALRADKTGLKANGFSVLRDDAFVCGTAKPRHKFATIRCSTRACRRTTIPAVHSIEEPFDVRL
jgi:hypothetical protein